MVYNSGQIKMKKYLIVLSAIVLFVFSGCQKVAGDLITKDFNVPGSYTELEVESAFDVTVSDAVDVITITAGENVMPKVIVEVVDNTLKIRLKPMASVYGGELKATIPYNANLTSVDLSGASEFHSEYGLFGEKVEVELSGASDFYCDIDAIEIDMNLSGASHFTGNIDASSLDLDMSGASDATLKGQVTTLDLDLSGASSIKKTINGSSYGFECDVCKGEMSGASDAYIHCNLIINVNLSGGSDLHFTGNAFTGDCTTSGGSNIIHDVLP
ncbi:MAG: DUF2807 domain-containing protein [Bacteroidales bacterium]|nr:DUF2807 domain-containing protein [Bacteroidales bacterium]